MKNKIMTTQCPNTPIRQKTNRQMEIFKANVFLRSCFQSNIFNVVKCNTEQNNKIFHKSLLVHSISFSLAPTKCKINHWLTQYAKNVRLCHCHNRRWVRGVTRNWAVVFCLLVLPVALKGFKNVCFNSIYYLCSTISIRWSPLKMSQSSVQSCVTALNSDSTCQTFWTFTDKGSYSKQRTTHHKSTNNSLSYISTQQLTNYSAPLGCNGSWHSCLRTSNSFQVCMGINFHIFRVQTMQIHNNH